MSDKWYVYIIEAECGSLYTGITTDVERRYLEHQSMRSGGKRGAKYFRSRSPKQIVFCESFDNRSKASVREAEIKAKSRSQKERLIKESLC